MKHRWSFRLETWRYRRPFVIARGSLDGVICLVAEVIEDELVGRGEAEPHETDPAEAVAAMRSAEAFIASNATEFDRARLRHLLPAGAVRNALDCALWDLEAKKADQRAWALAGLNAAAMPEPVPITATISLGTPAVMAAEAAEKAAMASILKLKLGGPLDDDVSRVVAVRDVVPGLPMIVDANEGWSLGLLAAIAPRLGALGVLLIEQPLPAGCDGAIAEARSPVPLCADESLTDCASLALLPAGYAVINIKLDKCGGLTEGLALASAAQARGLSFMVGSNGGTSLAAAPAFLLASRGALYADIDSPTMLVGDRPQAMRFAAGLAHPPAPSLWG